ncbi:MAG: HD-GYP domain-containing protein [Spirochaetes bacterium]|nr:HD-GYP domain-containing protein [Spirochaetota bacterium]
MLERCDANDLRPGMVVGAAVTSDRNNATLIEANTILTDKLIDTLKKHEVWFVFIRKAGEETDKPAAAPLPKPIPTAPVPLAKKEIIDRNTMQEGGKTIIKIDSVRAQEFHAASVQQTAKIFDAVRKSGSIDVKQVKDNANALVQAILANTQAFSSLRGLRSRDMYTYQHSVDVSALSVILAKALNMKEIEIVEIGLAGLLHDIGILTVASSITNKAGRLTDAERQQVQRHVVEGYDKLIKQQIESRISQAVLHHHEWVNGKGYPAQLQDRGITYYGKILAVCDVYSALVTQSLYRPPFQPYKAMQVIMGEAGSHFDMNIAKAFQQVMGIYPNGSIVRLSDGRITRVIDQNPTVLIYPIVQVLKDAQGIAMQDLVIVDLKETRNIFVKEVLGGETA